MKLGLRRRNRLRLPDLVRVIMDSRPMDNDLETGLGNLRTWTSEGSGKSQAAFASSSRHSAQSVCNDNCSVLPNNIWQNFLYSPLAFAVERTGRLIENHNGSILQDC